MNSLTAVLAWDYLRRNRRLLLFFAFLANVPFISVVLPLKGIDFAEQSHVTTPIVAVVTWCITLITVYGMMITQHQLGGLYLQPISTFKIVTHYFWIGAAAVAWLIAFVIGLWRWLVVPDFPLAWPLLFGLVAWGVSQPWFCVGVRSMRAVVIAIVLVVSLCVWYLMRHGMIVFSGEPRTAAIRFGVIPSASDVVVGAAAVAAGFVLSVYRVTRDRSGRHSVSLLSRLGDAWGRWQREGWVDRPQRFASPADAYESFVFRSRAIALPATVVTVLSMVWVVALIYGGVSRSLGNLLEVALIGSFAAAYIEVWIAAAFFISMQVVSSERLCLPVFGSDRGAGNLSTNYATRFFETLPISNRDLAAATLRSSLSAIIWSTIAIVGSLALMGFLHMFSDTELGWMSNTGRGLAATSLRTTFGSALIAFVLLNLSFVHWVLVKKHTFWLALIVPIGLAAVFSVDFILYLGVAILIWLLAQLVCLTIQDLRTRDVTPRSAALIWGGGVALTAVVSIYSMNAYPDGSRPHDLILIAIAVTLVMSPFLATPIAVRRLRNT